jgi:sugar phosphate isomerase/epimerase
MYRFDYSDAAQVKELVQRLNRAGETLHQAGLQFLYHNHNCEFLKLSTGKCAYDHIIEETNPEYVNFEFDSYWSTEAGVEAVVLESHKNWIHKSPLESMEISGKYLQEHL